MRYFYSAIIAFLVFSCSQDQKQSDLVGNTTETTNVVQAELKGLSDQPFKRIHLHLKRIDAVKDTTLNFSWQVDEPIQANIPSGTYGFEFYNQDSTQGLFFTQKILENLHLGDLQLGATFYLDGIVENKQKSYTKLNLVGSQHQQDLSSSGRASFKKVAPGIYQIQVVDTLGKTINDTLDLRNPPAEVQIQWKPGSTPIINSLSKIWNLWNYWSFDQMDSFRVIDNGPRKINGVISGNASYHAEKKGKSIELQANSHVHFSSEPDSFIIKPNQDFAISMWFQSLASNRDTIALISTLPAPGYAFAFKVTPKDTAFLQITDYNNYLFLLPIPFVNTANQWHHLYFYRSGNLYGLQLDGQETASKTSKINHEFDVGILNLGVDARYSQYFEGLLDEVQIYLGLPPSSLIDSLNSFK